VIVARQQPPPSRARSPLEPQVVRGRPPLEAGLEVRGPHQPDRAAITRAASGQPGATEGLPKYCGDVTIGEVVPRETTIRVTILPTEQEHIDLFVRGFRATFQGALDVFKSAGEVEFVSFDRLSRTSVYRARWS